MADEVRLSTGHGPLTVPAGLYRLWNRYGWPSDETLKGMVEAQKEESAHGAEADQ